jgi:hypothetical protein
LVFYCGSWLASDGGLPADQSLPATPLIVPYAPSENAARDAPRSEGAGGPRSRAAGELPLGLLSGEKRAVYLGFYCGSWLASDGGLPADQSLPATPLIVPYAPRGNAARDAPRSEGADGSRSRAAGELPLGLLSGEKRAVYLGFYCGSWLASDGGLPADQILAGVHRTLWERACPRWRPASRPVSSSYPADRSLRSAWECSPGRSAFRRGGLTKIKSSRRATARPVEWWRAKRVRRCFVGCLAGWGVVG